MHCSTFPRENPALVRGVSRLDTDTPAEALAPVPCPRCGVIDTSEVLENFQPSGRLSDPVAHALIDHLLLIETELATLRRLLLEEVGL